MDHQFLQFFAYTHLPVHLQIISMPFAKLAHLLAESLPHNSELDACLHRLLEAKDCAVRAQLWKD